MTSPSLSFDQQNLEALLSLNPQSTDTYKWCLSWEMLVNG